MRHLSAILANRQQPHQPFVLLQSSTTQSALPLLLDLLRTQASTTQLIILCCLYPPSALLGKGVTSRKNIKFIDWTSYVPGYDETDAEIGFAEMTDALGNESSGPTTFIVDSVNTLVESFSSSSGTYKFLSQLLKLIRSRQFSSRLICHITAPSPIISLLQDMTFSPLLTHLIVHPPVLIKHICTSFLTPPPPAPKFWRVFPDLSERRSEIERLVFGPDGEGGGGGGSADELVVDIIVRGGRRERRDLNENRERVGAVERVLEGWSRANGPCELSTLVSLKDLWGTGLSRTTAIEQDDVVDSIAHMSFIDSNPSVRQESGSRLNMPYVRQDESKVNAPKAAEIFYDPDSADDLDDEDPDEDLNF